MTGHTPASELLNQSGCFTALVSHEACSHKQTVSSWMTCNVPTVTYKYIAEAVPVAVCRSDNSWRSIVDVLFCAAMGPPGGGRNNVTPRYLRHFNLIAISDFDDETYSHIYTVSAFVCIACLR